MYWVNFLSHDCGFYTVLASMPIVPGLQKVAEDDMFLYIIQFNLRCGPETSAHMYLGYIYTYRQSHHLTFLMQFNIICEQHHTNAFNPFLNSKKNGDLKVLFSCTVNVTVFRTVQKGVQCSPIVLFTHNVIKFKGAVHKNGDVDDTCKWGPTVRLNRLVGCSDIFAEFWWIPKLHTDLCAEVTYSSLLIRTGTFWTHLYCKRWKITKLR